MREIILISILENVAPAFHKAVWRKREVNKSFRSLKELSEHCNLKNCNYKTVVDGKVIRTQLNGLLDGYGRRYTAY